MWRRDIILPEADINAFAQTLSSCLQAPCVIALHGDLGSGKSTLARAFIQHRAGIDDVPSPTFTLVQYYDTPTLPIAHYDLYRIESSTEWEELGLEEAANNGICLIEWPERLGPQLQRLQAAQRLLTISLIDLGDRRHYTLTTDNEKWGHSFTPLEQVMPPS